MARRRISFHWLGRRRVKALSLSLLGVLILVTVYLFASYDFYVFDISVEGNEAISSEEILEASGIEGYSIFFIDPQKVAKAVASLPDVAEAEVRPRSLRPQISIVRFCPKLRVSTIPKLMDSPLRLKRVRRYV